MQQILDPVTELMMDAIGAVLAGFIALWALDQEPREELAHTE